MKKHLTILSFSFITIPVFSQTTPAPNVIPSNSNMRIMKFPGNLSPLTCELANYYGALWTIENYLPDLLAPNEVTMINLSGNVFAGYPYNSPNLNKQSHRMNYHTGKFYFEGNSDIGIDSGIVMSTGMIHGYCRDAQLLGMGIQEHCPGITYPAQYNSTGPNGAGNFGAQYTHVAYIDWPNSAAFERDIQYPELVAMNNGDSIWDANVIEFDVIPIGKYLSVDYVFGSEEWPLFHCDSTRDVMGIFVSGPGINGQQNIAVLPGTNTPVNTWTIFPANAPCHPENNGAASPYFINNSQSQNIIYNGITPVLRGAIQVNPYDTYHVKLMIADGTQHPYDSMFIRSNTAGWNNSLFDAYHNDSWDTRKGRALYDSGLMLKSKSLRSVDSMSLQFLGGSTTTAQYPYAVRGCMNAVLRFTVDRPLPIARQYTIEWSGNAQAGLDYATLPTTLTLAANANTIDIPVQPLTLGSGNKSLTAKLVNTNLNCDAGTYIDSTTLVISDGYYAWVTPSDTAICDTGCSVQLEARGEPFVSYSWTPNNTLSNANIWNPIATPTQTTTYQVAVNAPNGYPCPNGSNTARVQVGFSTSVKDITLENIKVYPNPFTQGLSIQAENLPTNTVLAVKITDVLGRIHYAQSATITAHNQQLQSIGSTLPQGTYFIEIEDPSGKYFRQQIVKY